MNITRHNCEAVFLDYYEKNLSPVEVAEVLFFLEENPDLKELFESFESISLKQEPIKFPDKEVLKKKSRLGETPSSGVYNSEGIDRILSSEITTANCEQFFIAYAEGMLSSQQKEKLNHFLFQFPEYKKEYDFFQQCRLSIEKIPFEGKDSLKRSFITNENREEYFIRSVEKDLNRAEEEELKLFLDRNPEFRKERKLFSKTLLSAETIFFDDKSSLKKKEKRPVVISIFSRQIAYYAAAAVILLMIGLFFFFRGNDNTQTYFAQKYKPFNNTVSSKAIEKSEKTKEQKIIPEINNGSINPQPPAFSLRSVSIKNKSVVPSQPEIKKEEKKLQPVITADDQNLISEREPEKLQIIQEEVVAVNKQEKKNETGANTTQTVAFATSAESDDEYQTFGSYARKKIKATLGINNANPCEREDKLSVWDLAMAAKNGVQNLIGTKAVDVNKVCDGKGDQVEYIFAAGNFEISKSTSK